MTTIPPSVPSVSSSVRYFWDQFIVFWDELHILITGGHEQRIQALELINGLLTEEDFKNIQIELTLGEVNRNAFPNSSQLVELYISPRLLKKNIPLMEEYYAARPNLLNLSVYKYRAYNVNDPIIDDIEYTQTDTMPGYTAKYTDFGYQSSTGYDAETKQPVLNLVIYVKKPIADIILRKKKVTFTDPQNPSAEPITMEKWLPQDSTAVDVLLLNVLGEHHLVNDIGYIEFLPDGDPLIADGSVFCELSDLKGDIKLLESSLRNEVRRCKTCDRHQRQSNIHVCSRCKKALYCSVGCQKKDYPNHKKRCNPPTDPTAVPPK